jgi:putative N-acetyltransferase (TIGR04045 family)
MSALYPAAVREDGPAVGSTIVCREACGPGERADHYAIRHQVFVAEQAVFRGSDVDSRDGDDSAILLIGYHDGVPAGGVRLYEIDPDAGIWQGDRLAVLQPYRVRGVGAPLVRCAVATAAGRGGRAMIAHIQLQNVGFFRRLGWTAFGGTEVYAGLPHQPMSIDLPPPDVGLELVRRLSAGVSARDL